MDHRQRQYLLTLGAEPQHSPTTSPQATSPNVVDPTAGNTACCRYISQDRYLQYPVGDRLCQHYVHRTPTVSRCQWQYPRTPVISRHLRTLDVDLPRSPTTSLNVVNPTIVNMASCRHTSQDRYLPYPVGDRLCQHHAYFYHQEDVEFAGRRVLV